jgi:hypothetical protein
MRATGHGTAGAVVARRAGAATATPAAQIDGELRGCRGREHRALHAVCRATCLAAKKARVAAARHTRLAEPCPPATVLRIDLMPRRGRRGRRGCAQRPAWREKHPWAPPPYVGNSSSFRLKKRTLLVGDDFHPVMLPNSDAGVSGSEINAHRMAGDLALGRHFCLMEARGSTQQLKTRVLI